MFTLTTANTAEDTLGVFVTKELDLGILSVSYSYGYNSQNQLVRQLSFGPTVGFGYAQYQTNTGGGTIVSGAPPELPDNFSGYTGDPFDLGNSLNLAAPTSAYHK